MRIALRPSGGRGDYELAGSYNRLHASDLLGKRFFFQLTPGLTIDGRAAAHRLSGKPRIRPEDGKHAYVLIGAVLLMPPSRRELLRTPNEIPILRKGSYTIAGIDVDVIAHDSTTVTFAPKSVWARTRGGLLRVDYTDRMAIVSSLWNAAALVRSEISELLKEHKSAAVSGDHSRLVTAASAIQRFYGIDDDVLPLILHDFELPDAWNVAYSGVDVSATGFETEDDSDSPEVSQRERIYKWRRQVDRGPGARKFSLKVREAYDYTCAFSGERLPKLPTTGSAGVDGAHILPWSSHQLNSVSNGLCLCKLCHWAFDNSLIILEHDSSAGRYVISLAPNIEVEAQGKLDLSRFRELVGPLDPSRLPSDRALWPSPRNIHALNSSE